MALWQNITPSVPLDAISQTLENFSYLFTVLGLWELKQSERNSARGQSMGSTVDTCGT